MQKPNGSFFKQRKWLREDACCSVFDEHPRRHAESQNEYTNRRIKELAADGVAYQSEIRRVKDELRIAKNTIVEIGRFVVDLKRDIRREIDGGRVAHERARDQDTIIDDERLRDLFRGRERRRDSRERESSEETDFERRFGR